MSFEMPPSLESGEETQPTAEELAALHTDFLAAARKRGYSEIAYELPQPEGTYPRRYKVDFSNAPEDDLRVILPGDRCPSDLLVTITEPHVIDPARAALVESVLVSWVIGEEDGSRAQHAYFIYRDEASSTDWGADYQVNDGDELTRAITHRDLLQLRFLMSYIEYAALCGHLKRA